MPALQVRDFPQPLYDRLKEQAARDHRSMAQQALFYIEGGLNGSHKPNGTTTTTSEQERSIYTHRFEAQEEIDARAEKRRRLLEKVQRNPIKVPVGFPSPEEILRAIRDDKEDELDARIAEFVKARG